jgi:hypothetical protein
MILPGETEAGTAGTQPCRGISRWAHRDDERGREDSFLRRPTSIGFERPPYALKIPARRAEYSLTENVASPFHAEPTAKSEQAIDSELCIFAAHRDFWFSGSVGVPSRFYGTGTLCLSSLAALVIESTARIGCAPDEFSSTPGSYL